MYFPVHTVQFIHPELFSPHKLNTAFTYSLCSEAFSHISWSSLTNCVSDFLLSKDFLSAERPGHGRLHERPVDCCGHPQHHEPAAVSYYRHQSNTHLCCHPDSDVHEPHVDSSVLVSLTVEQFQKTVHSSFSFIWNKDTVVCVSQHSHTSTVTVCTYTGCRSS